MDREHQKEAMEGAYRERGKAPWIPKRPAPELATLVQKKFITPPMRVIDVGSGEGQHAVYLAEQGFEVVGLDFSSRATSYAQKLGREHRVEERCHFYEADVLKLSKLAKKEDFQNFDFILEWGLLHFLMPDEREKYVKDLSVLVSQGAKYLSLSFNDQATEWGEPGQKYRTSTLTGAKLYYSSHEELEELFSPYFTLVDARMRHTIFDNSPFRYTHNVLWMERR